MARRHGHERSAKSPKIQSLSALLAGGECCGRQSAACCRWVVRLLYIVLLWCWKQAVRRIIVNIVAILCADAGLRSLALNNCIAPPAVAMTNKRAVRQSRASTRTAFCQALLPSLCGFLAPDLLRRMGDRRAGFISVFCFSA